VDGLVHVDLLRLKPGKRQRYLGAAGFSDGVPLLATA